MDKLLQPILFLLHTDDGGGVAAPSTEVADTTDAPEAPDDSGAEPEAEPADEEPAAEGKPGSDSGTDEGPVED